MAAQERAKHAQQKQQPAQPNPTDAESEILCQLDEEVAPPSFDASILPPSAATNTTASLIPPPRFEEATLPPPSTAAAVPETSLPPPFHMVEDSVMEQVAAVSTSSTFHPVAPTYAAMPSAPALEDLLDMQHSVTSNPLDGLEMMLPPPAPPVAEEDNAFLAGLSDEERRELLKEQHRILEQIEREKVVAGETSANAAADAFDQRSGPAIARIAGEEPCAAAGDSRSIRLGSHDRMALHGPERTRAAIENGTAMLVQCLSCNNWMQVAQTASLMLCPVCQVVSPVDRQSAVLTKEEAMQMEADRKMAEQLQQEEYQQADREEQEEHQQQQADDKKDQSWWDWLGLGSTTTVSTTSTTPTTSTRPTTTTAARYVAPSLTTTTPVRGDVAVTRPPGSSPPLYASTMGQTETISFSRSYDEQEGLLNSSNNTTGHRPVPTARVAQRQPLFSCVADSITSAASAVSTALSTTTLAEDEEGQVHGVDATGLLAVTTVGRAQQPGGPSYRSLREDEH